MMRNLQIARLRTRHALPEHKAALIAFLIYGEARQ